MKTMKNRLISLTLPLILLGCQVAPGRLGGIPAPASNAAQSAATTPLDIHTDPIAKDAVISTDATAIANPAPEYGGLTLSIKWPEPQRKTQVIPTTANYMWVKAYSIGQVGDFASTSGVNAPEGTVIVSRVVAKDAKEAIPLASPTPFQCCQPPNTNATLFISLPKGPVGLWVGTFVENPETAMDSIFLSSGQKAYTIQANKVLQASALVLGGNPVVSPSISGVSPANIGAGASFMITGSNFGNNVDDVKVSLYQAAGCPSCQPQTTLLTVTAASPSVLTVMTPNPLNSNTYKLQVTVNGISVVGGSLGVFSQGLGVVVSEATTRRVFPNTGEEYATAQGSRVTVSKVFGTVCCNQDQYDLPFSAVSVKQPDNTTISLDASNSFVVDQQGTYTLTVSSGDAKGTAKVGGYRLNPDWSVRTAACQFCGDDQSKLALRPEIVSNFNNGSGLQAEVHANVNDAYLIDAQDAKVNGTDFTGADYTITVPRGMVVSNSRKITAGTVEAGNAVVTARFKYNQATSTKTLVVYEPKGINHNVPGTLSSNQIVNARVVYGNPVNATTVEVGGSEDFSWTSSDNAVMAIDSIDANNARLVRNEVGQVLLTIRSLADTSLVVTKDVTVN